VIGAHLTSEDVLDVNKLLLTGIGMGTVTLGLYGGLSIYATQAAKAEINTLIEDVDDHVVVEYRDVNVSLFGSDITINDVSVAPIEAPEDKINIDQIIVRKFDDKSDFPTVLDASIKGIQIDQVQTNVPMLQPFLAQAGYEKNLAFNLDTKYEYDASSGEITLEQFRLGAEDFGYLEATFKLGNFNPDAVSNAAVVLHSAEIVYQDQSFAENLLASMAAANNQEVDQYKTQLAAGLEANAQFLISPDNPVAMQALQATVAFIQDPEGFSISARPQQPLLVSDLVAAGDPQTWMEMLNLEIEIN
jgi:hypothetical protein